MLYGLNRLSPADLETRLRPWTREDDPGPEDAALVCVQCGYSITTLEQRLAIQGAHEHRCVNPAQIVFRIGCFAQAPGCGSVGAPTSAHSWFAGYRWSIAVCAACGIHLGWRYSGPDTFYGLILARLRMRSGA